jgi:hypothetical protein
MLGSVAARAEFTCHMTAAISSEVEEWTRNENGAGHQARADRNCGGRGDDHRCRLLAEYPRGWSDHYRHHHGERAGKFERPGEFDCPG